MKGTITPEECYHLQIPPALHVPSLEPEEMYPRSLRKLADEVFNPQLIIPEKLGESSEIPTDRKRGNLTPIFKKGKKKDPRNYRLINLTSVPSKIVEHICLETLLKYMENKQVIEDSQHGFTKGRSCLTSLVAFYEGVTALVDRGSFSCSRW